MPKAPKFPATKVSNNGKEYWQVSIPANMSAEGKRGRRFFEKERDAERFASSLRAKFGKGIRGELIDYRLSQMAAEAAAILEPFGASILDAAKAYAANAEARGVNESFRDRYDRFVSDNEGDWSPRYLIDMEKVPQWVGDDFMKLPVASITPAIIDQALRDNGAAAKSTRKMRSARVLPVLNERTRKKRAINIEIMTDEQVKAMLAACATDEETRVVALLLFAGIRPDASHGEVSRLDWSAVEKNTIYITGEVSKTDTDRHIPITPKLRKLIKGHPKSGSILPLKYGKRIQELRKAAGIAGKQDITRHTFASHFLAAYGEDATKAAMGHTPNSGTLFRHYRRAVTRQQGKEYFA
jgi:integrase